MEKSETVRIEIPAGLKLSEEEKTKISSVIQNEIVDVIKAKRSKTIATIFDEKA